MKNFLDNVKVIGKVIGMFISLAQCHSYIEPFFFKENKVTFAALYMHLGNVMCVQLCVW